MSSNPSPKRPRKTPSSESAASSRPNGPDNARNSSAENSTPPLSPKDNFAEAKAHARQAAQELRAAAEAKAREFREAAEIRAREFRETASARVEAFRGKAEHAFGDATARARTMQEESETFIRENPLKAVACALLAGFFLGAIFKDK